MRPTFRPIHLGIWMRRQNLLGPFRLPEVSVPGDCLCVLVHPSLVAFGDGAAPKIVVMGQEPDLRVEAGVFDGWPEVLSHVPNFYSLRKKARRHFAVLI